MKNFFKILKFEYLNCITNKAFIIITVFLVCASGLFAFLPGIIVNFAGSSSEEDAPADKIAIMKSSYDDSLVKSEITPFFPGMEVIVTNEDRKTVESKVDNGDYSFAAEITSPLTFVYITKNNTIYDTNGQTIGEALKNMYTVSELSKHGLDQKEADELINTGYVMETYSTGTDQAKNYLPVYLMMCILFVAITTYGQLVTQSVVSEKNTRAMELLITCAKPSELMFGKVIGAGLAGLTQLGIIFGSMALPLTFMPSDLIPAEIREYIKFPVETMLLALLFFLLGYFMYAFLLDGLTTPVMFVLMGVYFVLVFMCSSDMVNSTAMTVLSYFPLSSPMAMFVRSTLVDIPVWEIIISVVLQIGTIVVFGMLAAGIYKIGVLMYGNPPKPAEIIKMLKKSK